MHSHASCVVLLISAILLSVEGKNTHGDGSDRRALSDPGNNPYVKNECAYGEWKTQDNLPNLSIPQPTWLQTPSVVEISKGHYRALGRIIHAKYLRDQLSTQKKLNFGATRATMGLVQQLDILADTLYIEGVVVFYGIKNVKIYAREIVASEGSKIDISAPDWKQEFANAVATKANGDGTEGENGEHGVAGPQVEIFCDVINGAIDVTSNGGRGHKGQNGGPGSNRPNSYAVKADKDPVGCNAIYFKRRDFDWWKQRCLGKSQAGEKGEKGKNGGRGGNAGKPGNGGNAGSITLRYRESNGQIKLKTCAGIGAQPANNGQGGNGGKGGQGGRGRQCFVGRWQHSTACQGNQTAKAEDGERGKNGAPGSTPKVKGSDGSVSKTLIQSGKLDEASKGSFPVELLVITRRQAVDLLLGDSYNQKGKEALKFIVNLATGRNDLEDIKKDAQRKLGFLGKQGYDIFGKNIYFTPLIRWEALSDDVDKVKKAAGDYEKAMNNIISSVNNKEDFRLMASKISQVSSNQVKAERKRLVAARDVAESEKRMYVKGIESQEQRMMGILSKIRSMLRAVHDKARKKLNREEFIAVLQGITGFASAIAGKDPFDFIDTALSIANYDANKPCLESLDSIRRSIKKWLTFGKEYKPLKDSSDLNFDQVDVVSIPDIMKVNLDISKEQLAKDLVCLLEEAPPKPRDIASLKAEIESYFIVGGARIEMIGKVMDIDNDIGGYNFDIPLLEKTEKDIADANKSPQGSSLSNDLRQTFTENLLSTYKELERSFMEKLYLLHKALGFRTLWNLDDLIGSFQRIASENALGVGRLNGAVELTDELRKVSEVITKARRCFSKMKYTTSVHKWSFNDINNKQMFEELKKGYTRFSIGINKICRTCYNARLIKMYIELYGPDQQASNIPDKVHLRIRHLSGSHFLAGDNNIKHYRLPITDYRDLKFDRFSISDERKCRRRKRKGKKSRYCVEKDDSRWKPMCSHSLNGPADADLMMGKEECTSPSGYYDLMIPVDKTLACDDTKMRDTNCKDIDLTKFTKMNVWVYYLYWSRKYPKEPSDPMCRVATVKKNETEVIEEL